MLSWVFYMKGLSKIVMLSLHYKSAIGNMVLLPFHLVNPLPLNLSPP
jgi:hypothetical protein